MNWLLKILKISVYKKYPIIIMSVIVSLYGIFVYNKMEVDVFPNLTAPQVTIVTETKKMAPEETELLVTYPLERILNGGAGVRRIRSMSNYGYSIIWVDFKWNVKPNEARQVVMEKLQIAQGRLPENIKLPAMMPASNAMSEILTLGVQSSQHNLIELYDFSHRVIRQQIMQIPGISQVMIAGGRIGQWRVELDSQLLMARRISSGQVETALGKGGRNGSAGFWVKDSKEMMIRIYGQYRSRQEIENIVVATQKGIPIMVKDLGKVSLSWAPRRGGGGINGSEGTVITVIKQPQANTVSITRKIKQVLNRIEKNELPAGMVLKKDLFNQNRFIKKAVSNVSHSMGYGALLIIIVLFVFMMNLRSALISIVALPLSILMAVIMLYFAGYEINTMTLGGITLALGVLIDDCIIGVENIWKRLRQNSKKDVQNQQPLRQIIFKGAKEVLRSVVFANILIIIVFIPIFFISGMEGKLMAPLGFAYISANFASLVVSITLTPALSSLLFTKLNFKKRDEGILLTWLKKLFAPIIKFSLNKPFSLALFAGGILVFAILIAVSFPRRFLPEWNEGALNVKVIALPGSSLTESEKLAAKVEKSLLAFPEVVSVSRKTGRTEEDVHGMDVFVSEMEVKLNHKGRGKDALIAAMRKKLKEVRGIKIQIGQPLSHRIDHMLSGSRTSLALKIKGKNLNVMRRLAQNLADLMQQIDGIVDVNVQPVINLPQHRIVPKPYALAQAGLYKENLTNFVSRALYGNKAGVFIDQGWRREITVSIKNDYTSFQQAFNNLRIHSPVYGFIPLSSVAETELYLGPNKIPHENSQRTLMVTANFSASDTVGTVKKLQKEIDSKIIFPPGYTLKFGGQFRSEQRAAKALILSSIVIAISIFLILMVAFGSLTKTLLMLSNLPFAMVGAIFALFLTNTPLSAASMLGFITLFGIAVRNGIILVSHYEYLENDPENNLSEREIIIQGTLEKLSPFVMTALTSILALVPMVLNRNSTGNEIQAPVAIVMMGGLISALILSLMLLPSFYYNIFKKAD
ncbi:MAG: efflux RND transporter permease subunit [Myxococcota bacterium]